MGDANQAQYTARWYQRVGAYIGVGLNPASLTLGGGLAAQLPFADLIWIMPLSAAALGGIVGACSVVARRRREAFAEWSGSTFGLGVGLLLLNLMMGLGMGGWSGFQLGLAGASLSNLLSLPGWIGVVALAIGVFILTQRGVTRWNRLVWVTTVASLALILMALAIVSSSSADIQSAAPPTLTLRIWAASSVLSFASLFALRSADFAWDIQSDSDVWIDAASFTVVYLTTLFVGALLYRASGGWNLVEVFANTEYAFLGQLFIVLSLISPAVSSVHSGALAWAAVLRTNTRVGAVLFLTIGALLGITRFDQRLLPFLDWLGAAVPPAIVLMLIYVLLKRPPSSRVMLLAWIGGAGVGIAFKVNEQLVHLAAGALTSLLILAIGAMVERLMLDQTE